MIQRNTCLSLTLALALATTGALAAEAEHERQPSASNQSVPAGGIPGTPGMPMGSMQGQSGAMPMMGMMQMMMSQHGMAGHVEGRIAFIKAELKITDAQQPLWNAVADAMRANAKEMAGIPHGMMGSPGTLPEKLAAHEKALAAHLDGVRRLRTAFDPLYAALSPGQKKAADGLMIGPMGVMGIGVI